MRKTEKVILVLVVIALSAIVISACGGSSNASSPPPVSQQDSQYDVNNLYNLRQKYPLPILTDSSDLKNQINYAKVQSDPNKIEYLAFINYQGAPYATFTIKGQVSAEATRITAPVKDKCYYDDGGNSGALSCVQDPQPDLTGTFFSQSGGGYFAYLTDGALIQWPASVEFITSDQPFHITQPPQLSVNENAAISVTHAHIK